MNPEFKEGATVTITGENAEQFVRYRDIEMEQTIPNIDEELEELDRLIKMKEALLLKKKKDSEMC